MHLFIGIGSDVYGEILFDICGTCFICLIVFIM